MLFVRSALIRLSPQTRTALTSLVVGFIAAVLLIKLIALLGVIGGTGMYVEDDGTSLENDDDYHNGEDLALDDDDEAVARSLSKTVRIVCCVFTSSGGRLDNAAQVLATWGSRCNKLFFVSDKNDIVGDVPIVQADRSSRIFGAFDLMFRKDIEDADWFLQADDTTYIIMENLRYFLSSLNPREPLYLRHHFSAATQRVSIHSEVLRLYNRFMG